MKSPAVQKAPAPTNATHPPTDMHSATPHAILARPAATPCKPAGGPGPCRAASEGRAGLLRWVLVLVPAILLLGFIPGMLANTGPCTK